MNTNQYKTGVLRLIARIKNYNPEIGQYISHAIASDREFLIQLTNGTLKLPPEVAHSQEVFPALVPEAWIIEIEKSFIKCLTHLHTPKPKSRWRIIFGFLM
jgi:hypothetical protein